MVGRSVMVPANTSQMDASGVIGGFIDLPAATPEVKLSVLNSAGELVNQISIGGHSGGELRFEWDGTNMQGARMPFGDYQIKAEATYGGASQQIQTFLKSNVDSVSVGKDGSLTLNLAGRGSVALKDVRQIN
jgi:flagellar basal-body rod modification protein FlgD